MLPQVLEVKSEGSINTNTVFYYSPINFDHITLPPSIKDIGLAKYIIDTQHYLKASFNLMTELNILAACVIELHVTISMCFNNDINYQ